MLCERGGTRTESARPKNPKTPINPLSRTSDTPEFGRLGLVATRSGKFGGVSMHDPVEGVWWDLQVKEAPAWAVSGARKGEDLYKGGNRRSHRPTSREMEGIREGGPSGGTRPIHRTRPGRGVPESGPFGDAQPAAAVYDWPVA